MFQYLYSVFQTTLELVDVLLVLIRFKTERVLGAEEGRIYIQTVHFFLLNNFYVPWHAQWYDNCS